MSELNQKLCTTIEAWRQRPIEGEHPVCVRGWPVAAAYVGRRGACRGDAGGSGRAKRWLPGDLGRSRGHEGGSGKLAELLALAEGPRAKGGEAGDQR